MINLLSGSNFDFLGKKSKALKKNETDFYSKCIIMDGYRLPTHY